jgi:hypothetical protein
MTLRGVFMAGSLLTMAASTASGQQLDLIAPVEADGTVVTYFIGMPAAGSASREGDDQLCGWAMDAWGAAADGQLRFSESPESTALIRVYFVPALFGQYGEMRPIIVDGRRGAEVYVRPDTEALGPEIARLAREDDLFRDTIVYLTCLHELGHALGLVHTAEFEDVMYFFGYGGDIPAFFGRYRDALEERDDIELNSGLSTGDIAELKSLYGLRQVTVTQ